MNSAMRSSSVGMAQPYAVSHGGSGTHSHGVGWTAGNDRPAWLRWCAPDGITEEAQVLLEGKRVIALVEEDYEDLEHWYPVLRLREEGAEVVVAGLGAASYRGKYGVPCEPDTDVEALDMDGFDGILVVGGWAPDKLRRSEKVLELVREADRDGKVLGVICHGGWVPASAGVLKGRTMTCTVGIKDDVMNAGANYVDEPVVVDGNLVTARRPPDLPGYGAALVEAFRAGSA
jgi:protease I